MVFADLLPPLQHSIGPVILISGVGLLMLSMTNRFARIIDRSRLLGQTYRTAVDADRSRLLAELKILSRRARLVRVCIALAALSVLLAALLIMSLFLGVLLDLAIAGVIAAVFIACVLALIASLLLFISDINLSLKALWIELPAEAM